MNNEKIRNRMLSLNKKRLLFIPVILILTSCSSPKTDNCKGQILNLEMSSVDDPNNKLLDYYRTNSFVTITDTNQLLRFEKPGRIAHLFQPSAIDSTRRKYTYKVKEGVIKTANYQWDLLAQVDNDKKVDNIKYWLKSYDKSRKQIDHLDFAGWSADLEWFFSGRIDCDSTLHIILKDGKDRIFKTDETGKNNLIKTN
jgi:hypothetical protein